VHPRRASHPRAARSTAGQFAVDVFFLLSGFLGAHVLLSRPSQIGVRAFVLRWLRLTPVYALCIAVYFGVAPHMGTGPFWYKLGLSASACGRYWWSSILCAPPCHADARRCTACSTPLHDP
jgi:peptidoglycan/LPS O-acetylase OafA/YrhL